MSCESVEACHSTAKTVPAGIPGARYNFYFVLKEAPSQSSLTGSNVLTTQIGEECQQSTTLATLEVQGSDAVQITARTWLGETYPAPATAPCEDRFVDLGVETTPCAQHEVVTASFLEAL